MSFFFVSIGMLLEVGFLFKQPGLVILIALSVLILKAIIAGLATALLGFAFRTAILAGLALSQVGEFSFILSRSGVEHGLLSGTTHQLFLAVSVLTMAATPFIIALAPRLADFALRLPLPGVLKTGLYPVSGIGDDKTKERLRDHLIVIGFGVNGRNVARAARIAHIPYLIIEMNPQTVRDEKAKGEPIHYGDSVQEAVLEAADIETARVVVVAISDPVATRQIIAVARRLNPKVYIIARTRYLQEMKPLYELGADEVIPEEFETSVEIFTRILMKYLVPRDEIEKLIAEVRADGYQMFRTLSKESVTFSDLEVHALDIEISAFRVAETSSLVGSYLSEIELRRRYGVTVLVIRRDSQTLINPGGDTSLCANDLLLIMGPPDKLANIVTIFSNPEGGG
jgi:CPA2 family monovalent cation:H+ antiporter-2